MLETLNRIRVVLVRTSHPGNIGAAARAMKTMGLSELVLVAPQRWSPAQGDPEATALAAGADDVLERARVVATLADALAGTTLAYGCTARVRGVALPELRPHAAAVALVSELARAAPAVVATGLASTPEAPAGGATGTADVALVFGNERTGLTNDELFQCQAAVHIPADAGYSSLNLAAAVQVLAYECRLAALDAVPPAPATDYEAGEGPADAALLEGYFEHLGRALAAIDFFKGRAPHTLMRRLRRLYFRARPSEREVMILRGILSDAERMARLAGQQQG